MNFKTTSFTSPLFWHFVKGHGKDKISQAKSSLELFLKEKKDDPIFYDQAKGKLLLNPPNSASFHTRYFSLEKNAGEIDSNLSDNAAKDLAQAIQYVLTEPRSICFADIPISHLPIHINRYYGIGLGFRRDSIITDREDLKPVEYYPRNIEFTLEHSCEDFNKLNGNAFSLKKYAKVPSQSESFHEIYHEREWRTFSDFEFEPKHLALIFFPTKEILNDALKESRFLDFFKAGVGYICGEDLYEASEASIE